MRYAEIILPIAGGVYTFSVDGELAGSVTEGCAVSVQFGGGERGRKIVTGIVRRMHSERPAYKKIKPVLALLFPEPVIDAVQMRLWEWMADYYMCTPGEVMRSALPSMLKPSGFSAEEFAADEFRPATVRFVSLAPAMADEEAFNETCEKLQRRAPKQYDALVEVAGHAVPVPRPNLKADSTILNALQKKGFIVIFDEELRITNYELRATLPELSTAQQTALDELREALRTREVALLFGVPSSGKSEIAFHAIASTLAKGRDVLLLLPEISLTTQFIKRVRAVFGERAVVYHSGLSDRRRAETYLRLVRSEGGSLIVGARSALFLPMKRLGLVVVDEEQDASYKQQDPAPRYNARDAAIVLAHLHGGGARVVLMSATPSLETWMNATSGKYGLVRLTERFGGTFPPETTISDTLRAVKRGERRSHFNKELLDRIGGALSRGEQVILFQNRRGIAPYIECTGCGWVPRCGHCGIPMSVHRGTLQCHYCGAVSELPSVCPSCGGQGLTTRGFGTEKIEEELVRLFPSAGVSRLDRDSAASERAYSRIINDFEHGAADILVGTQMVTKGLDFAGVSLVGVLNADNLLNHPDFRASERAYQLIAQVAGRAGRREARGEVVIQTASPGNPVIGRAAAGDYEAMAAELLAERAIYGYPPYSRLISVMLRHADREVLSAAARRFGELLRENLNHPAPTGHPSTGGEPALRHLAAESVAVLGPQPPVVEKIKGEYALIFLLKVPRSEPMSAVRETLQSAIRTLLADLTFRKVTVTPNVDPV